MSHSEVFIFIQQKIPTSTGGEMTAQFKIRTHCSSVAKAKRQLQLRQGEIDI